MATYLDEILVAHRAGALADQRSERVLRGEASSGPPVRGFRDALARGGADGVAVIAEVKRRSPSKGDLAADLDPAHVARAYGHGGATCLSVLTDREDFGGSARDLAVARAACELPVLRKDFTVAPADVYDARAMGADAVLLIAAALDDRELFELRSLTVELGMDALVEVHDEAELRRALAVGADLVGVNQRDLVTFEVDTERAVRVAEAMPDQVARVAESGIRGTDDLVRLADAGYQAVLVGESLVTAPDPGAAVSELVNAGRR